MNHLLYTTCISDPTCHVNATIGWLLHLRATLASQLMNRHHFYATAALSTLMVGRKIRAVIDLENEPPRLLGEYVDTVEDVVRYRFGDDVRSAPESCVAVRTIDLPALPVLADAVGDLHSRTVPIAGRAGWRVDGDGGEWYSDAWL